MQPTRQFESQLALAIIAFALTGLIVCLGLGLLTWSVIRSKGGRAIDEEQVMELESTQAGPGNPAVEEDTISDEDSELEYNDVGGFYPCR